jgi:hypothetical protein
MSNFASSPKTLVSASTGSIEGKAGVVDDDLLVVINRND